MQAQLNAVLSPVTMTVDTSASFNPSNGYNEFVMQQTTVEAQFKKMLQYSSNLAKKINNVYHIIDTQSVQNSTPLPSYRIQSIVSTLQNKIVSAFEFSTTQKELASADTIGLKESTKTYRFESGIKGGIETKVSSESQAVSQVTPLIYVDPQTAYADIANRMIEKSQMDTIEVAIKGYFKASVGDSFSFSTLEVNGSFIVNKIVHKSTKEETILTGLGSYEGVA